MTKRTRAKKPKKKAADEFDIPVPRYRLELVELVDGKIHRPALLDRPPAIADFVWEVVRCRDREVLGSIWLDGSHRAIGYTIAYVGTLDRVRCSPRGILLPALLANAASVVMFHNHPSGDPTPSNEDQAFTERVRESAAILDIKLDDHMIVGYGGSWVSMKRRGPWL